MNPESPPPQCSDGDIRLSSPNNETYPYLADYYYQVTSGFLEVCYHGNWISVCLSNDNVDSSHLAELACRSIYGFDGMLILIKNCYSICTAYENSFIPHYFVSEEWVSLFKFIQKLTFKLSFLLADSAGNKISYSLIIFCVPFKHTVFTSEVHPLGNSNYTTSDYSAVNFVCNSNSYYLSDCNSLVMYNSECQFHQDDAYLTCGIGTNYSMNNMDSMFIDDNAFVCMYVYLCSAFGIVCNV